MRVRPWHSCRGRIARTPQASCSITYKLAKQHFPESADRTTYLRTMQRLQASKFEFRSNDEQQRNICRFVKLSRFVFTGQPALNIKGNKRGSRSRTGGGLWHDAQTTLVQSGRSWHEAASGKYAPTQTVVTLCPVLGRSHSRPWPSGAYVSALRAVGATRSEQRAGGAHRCAGTDQHAGDGRGGEMETSVSCKAAQVEVCDPRNPRYNVARSLAVEEFIICFERPRRSGRGGKERRREAATRH